ncbi:MAG: nucleotidyl transferase AbiEii/AbiGii toxin family protein, partial [Thermoanaerobaculia bacterium]
MLKSKGIITDLQRDFLKFFSKLPDSNSFYLTGGTALADFFLGHRKSYDLNLFTREKKLILPFTNLLREKIRKKFNFNLIKRFETFIEIEIKSKDEETVVHLAYDSLFRLGK